jgi:hypothetical protein
MGAALGAAGIGGAVDAQAQPAPLPDYHWCPGQWWDPGWGDNWEWGAAMTTTTATSMAMTTAVTGVAPDRIALGTGHPGNGDPSGTNPRIAVR